MDFELNESQLRTVLANLPSFIVLIDRERHYVWVNRVDPTLTMDQVIGKRVDDFSHPDGREHVIEEIDRAFRGQVPGYYETRAYGAGVHDTWYGVRIIPIGAAIDGRELALLIATNETERIRAEQTLAQSEERYRSVVAALSEGIVLNAPGGTITASNQAAERILGLSADQMRGRTPLDPRWRAIHEDGSPFPGEDHPGSVALRTGQSLSNVIMGVHKPDGALTWISINAEPIFTPGQSLPTAVVASFSDITERLRAEEGQRVTAAELRVIADNLPVSFCYVDKDQRYRFANRVHAQLLGHSPESTVGKTVREIIGEELYPLFQGKIEQVLAGQRVSYMESYEIPGSPRVAYDINLLPDIDASGAVGGYFSLVLDISDRVRTEEALRTNQELLAEAQRIAKIGSWELDLHTNALRWSDEIFRIFEIDPAVFDASYEAFLDAIHPDDRDAVNTTYSRSVATREPYEIVHRLRMADGRIKHVRERCESHYADDGTALRSVGTVQDITDQRQAEQAVERLNLELEHRVRERTASLDAANKELATFTYTVSHDLKAPLRSIDGYSRLLLLDHADRLNDEGRNLLQIVRKSTAQMGQLIDDLLAYAHVERSAVATSPCDLHALLKALLAERASEIAERNVTIRMPATWPEVVADQDGLALALRNVLENALKFSQGVSEPVIEIGGQEQAASWLLWVRDQGIGFDMKYHDRIFEIFQRLQRTEEYPGTGVGLAIVRRAMERMGGRVWAESMPGQGSTFWLEIPKKGP
jgi:hypothetical protein